MICGVCPNCGFDLAKIEAFRIGPLFVDTGGARIWWRESPVRLTPSQRLIVSALARAGGAPIRKHILAEIVGHEGEQPENTVAVQVTRTNRAFHWVDPSFDRIENVRGSGLRWKWETADAH